MKKDLVKRIPVASMLKRREVLGFLGGTGRRITYRMLARTVRLSRTDEYVNSDTDSGGHHNDSFMRGETPTDGRAIFHR
jgi:hypothetical protein